MSRTSPAAFRPVASRSSRTFSMFQLAALKRSDFLAAALDMMVNADYTIVRID